MGTFKVFDVMVDLETTDLLPDRGGIIQIAAVKFDLKTQSVDTDFFDRCMFLPPNRYWSEGTRNWWMQQDQSIIHDLFMRREPPRTVMEDFSKWAAPMGRSEPIRFWAKPSHFDYNFVSSYFHDLNLMNPFHYRHVMDMRSFLIGLYYPEPVPDLKLVFDGNVHNALNDVLNQLKTLFAHISAAPEWDGRGN